ncbi:Mre11 DNA-binding presumed domain-containing protein [Dipodascopsis uninucleata]
MNGPNTIRILISSDNHVGYNERDPIRGDDSWRSFEEVMKIAKDKDVDMVLLAGDLFHENKPSRKSLYQVVKILRENCYGDRPCELELLSDARLALQDAFGHINYEDPNINVSIPVLAISGNHDDSAGEGHLAPLDIISATGLVNHFGRVPENDNIVIAPLLFQKGFTRIAIYGMANVRDERLYRTFRDHKVKFLRPDRTSSSESEWFNIMAVHQNHHSHTETGYLPENFLPNFLDLVVWGHEHECILDPQVNPETGFSVIQPGSSVATSLCEGEAVEKFVGLLTITGKKFEIQRIRLKTVRPFIMKDVILSRDSGFAANSKNKGQVIRWLIDQVDQLISEANNKWREDSKGENGYLATDEPPLPLIRLRVEYSGGYEVENPRRFSNRFVGRVANVNDIVQFYRKKSVTSSGKRNDFDKDSVEVVEGIDINSIKVQSLVEEFLKGHTLDILPESGLNEAISFFVDKDDRQAIKTFVDDSLESQIKKILTLNDINEDNIEETLQLLSKNQDQNSHTTSRSLDMPRKPISSRQSRVASDTNANKRKTKVAFSDDSDDNILPEVASRSQAISIRQAKETGVHEGETPLFVASDTEESEEILEASSDFEPEPEPTISKRSSRRQTAQQSSKSSARKSLLSKTTQSRIATSRQSTLPASPPKSSKRKTLAESSQRSQFNSSILNPFTKVTSQRTTRASNISSVRNSIPNKSSITDSLSNPQTEAQYPIEIIDDDEDDAFD